MAEITSAGEVVVATGICSWCDFHFTDERVLRYSEPALPGGWAYVELRHLDQDDVERLSQIPESAQHSACARAPL